MSRGVRVLPLAALFAAGGCFATRNDVRVVQSDLASFRTELLKANADQRDALASALRTLGVASDSVRVMSNRLTSVQGDIRGGFARRQRSTDPGAGAAETELQPFGDSAQRTGSSRKPGFTISSNAAHRHADDGRRQRCCTCSRWRVRSDVVRTAGAVQQRAAPAWTRQLVHCARNFSGTAHEFSNVGQGARRAARHWADVRRRKPEVRGARCVRRRFAEVSRFAGCAHIALETCEHSDRPESPGRSEAAAAADRRPIQNQRRVSASR